MKAGMVCASLHVQTTTVALPSVLGTPLEEGFSKKKDIQKRKALYINFVIFF